MTTPLDILNVYTDVYNNFMYRFWEDEVELNNQLQEIDYDGCGGIPFTDLDNRIQLMYICDYIKQEFGIELYTVDIFTNIKQAMQEIKYKLYTHLKEIDYINTLKNK